MSCKSGQGGNEKGVPQIEVTPEMLPVEAVFNAVVSVLLDEFSDREIDGQVLSEFAARSIAGQVIELCSGGPEHIPQRDP